MKKKTLLTCILFSFFIIKSSAQAYDLVVYGATPAGIAAAVSGAREGLRVGLVEESDRIGGIVAGGMSNTDFKSFESVQGFYREYMDRVVQYYERKYGKDSQQVQDCFHGAWYEPHVALAIFYDFIKEQPNITLLQKHRLVKTIITKNDKNSIINTAIFKNLDTNNDIKLNGKIFIDATYEGDLLAKAGVPYAVGRESRYEYGERWAGQIYFKDQQLLLGSTGEGDERVQCYNFRICMSKDPQNRLPIVKPDNYNRTEFLPLLEQMKAGKITKMDDQIIGINEIPNGKADFNDKMYSPVSLRLMGENDAWPDGTPEVRQQIFNRFKSYSLSLLWFLQHDAEVPLAIREEALQWGLPKDEFETYDNFPPFLYVREARRMVGDYVFIEPETQRAVGVVRSVLNPHSVAVSDYSMDSHGVLPPDKYRPDVVEGAFNYFVLPYQIPYDVMLAPNIYNLLVPVCVSASHVAFCSIRMEPTWTALGQAAGIAAAMSIQKNTLVKDVDIQQLQLKLHQKDAITFYVTDALPGNPYFEAVQYFGTRGYFHHLITSDSVTFQGRGKYLGKGQWLGPNPHHQVDVNLNMNAELATYWSNLAAVNGLPWQGITRGEYLNQLYAALKSKNQLPATSKALQTVQQQYMLDRSLIFKK